MDRKPIFSGIMALLLAAALFPMNVSAEGQSPSPSPSPTAETSSPVATASSAASAAPSATAEASAVAFPKLDFKAAYNQDSNTVDLTADISDFASLSSADFVVHFDESSVESCGTDITDKSAEGADTALIVSSGDLLDYQVSYLLDDPEDKTVTTSDNLEVKIASKDAEKGASGAAGSLLTMRFPAREGASLDQVSFKVSALTFQAFDSLGKAASSPAAEDQTIQIDESSLPLASAAQSNVTTAGSNYGELQGVTSSANESEIALVWLPVTIDMKEYYTVYYNTVDDQSTATEDTINGIYSSSNGEFYHKITGLQNNTTYYIWLVRCDSNYSGAYESKKLTVTTGAYPLAAPANISAVFDSSTARVYVHFDDVSGAKYYRIIPYGDGNELSTSSYFTKADSYTVPLYTAVSSGEKITLKVYSYQSLTDAIADIGSTPSALVTATAGATESATLKQPQNATVTAGYDSVLLSWDRDASVSDYSVYYSTGTDFSSAIREDYYSQPGATRDHCSIGYLAASTLYHFWIVGYDSMHTLKSVATTLQASTVTDTSKVPQNVKVTPRDGALAVSWDAVQGAYRYVVRYKAQNLSYYNSNMTYHQADTSYTITGLANGTAYDVTVAVVDSSDNFAYNVYSTPSTAVTATPVAAQETLAAPTNVTVRESYSELIVDATAASEATHGYLYYNTTDDFSTAGKMTMNKLSTGVMDTTVYTPGNQKYYMWIVTYNDDYSAKSASYAFQTSGGQSIIAAPTNVAATAGENSVNVSWSAVAGAAAYRVSYKGNGTSGSYITTATSYQVDADKAAIGSTYQYYVQAADTLQDAQMSFLGYPSELVYATTKEATVGLGSIQNALVSYGYTSLKVTFDKSSSIDHYVLFYGESSAQSDAAKKQIRTANISSSTITSYLSGLAKDTSYHLWLVGYNADETQKTEITTLSASTAAGALGQPANLKAASSDQQITLTWDAVPGATMYKVKYRMATDSYWCSTVVFYNTSFAMTGLPNGSTYEFQVSAASGSNDYDCIDDVPVSISATPVEAKVTLPALALASASGGYNSARICVFKGSSVSSYRVLYSETDDISTAYVFDGGNYVNSTTANFYPYGLENNKQYYFWIYGLDAGGLNKTPVLETSVTIGKDAMPAPTGVKAVPGYQAATVSWDPMAGAKYYRVEATYTANGFPYSTTYWQTDSTSYVVKNLQNDVEYKFRVFAFEDSMSANMLYESNPSEYATATPKLEYADFAVINTDTNQQYEDLKEAWNNAGSAAHFKLLPNKDGSARTITITSALNNYGSAVTLDLNGQNLVASNTYGSSAINNMGGQFTLTDTSTAKNGTVSNSKGKMVFTNNCNIDASNGQYHNGTFVIEAGNVSGADSVTSILNNGTLTINGGSVSGTIENGWIVNPAIDNYNWSGLDSVLTVTGGDLSKAIIANGDYAVYQNTKQVAVKGVSSPYTSGNSHFKLDSATKTSNSITDAQSALLLAYPYADLTAVMASNAELTGIQAQRTGSAVKIEPTLEVKVTDASELNEKITSVSYQISSYANAYDYASSDGSLMKLRSVNIAPASGQTAAVTLSLPARFSVPADNKVEVLQTRDDGSEDTIATAEVTTDSSNRKIVTFNAENGFGVFEIRAAGTPASTLQAKIDSVSGDTYNFITLDKDYSENLTIAKSQFVVLNLNGHTISNAAAGNTITNSGHLVIQGTGNVTNSAKDSAVILNQPYGIAVIQGGTVSKLKATEGSGSAIINHGEMKLLSYASVTSEDTAAPAVLNGWEKPEENVMSAASNLYISGTVTGGSYCLDNNAYGYATIVKGTVSGGSVGALHNKHVLMIQYATVDAGTGNALLNECSTNAEDYLVGYTEIDQGAFKGSLANNGGKMLVYYGLFDHDPTAFLYQGMYASEETSDTNYKYEVKEIVSAAGTLQYKIDQQKGDTENVITLDKDYAENIHVGTQQKVVIDLNGYTLKGSAGTPTVINSGSLTLKNSKTAGAVTNASGAAPIIRNLAYGQLAIMENVTVTDANAASVTGTVIENQGNLTLSGKVVSSGTASALIVNGTEDYQRNMLKAEADLFIQGATLTGGSYNVDNTYYGVATIGDGTFSGSLNGAIQNRHMLYVYNGTFAKGSGSAVVLHNIFSAAEHATYVDYKSGYAQIYGGKFTGTLSNETAGELNVYGGYYTEDPSAYLAHGLTAATPADVTGYTYQVKAAAAAAGTLQGLIDKVSGDVKNEITLDQDYTENIVISSTQNVVIHLNGHKIVNASDTATIVSSGSLTIDGKGSVENSGTAPALMNQEYGILTVAGSAAVAKSTDGNVIVNHGDMRLMENSTVNGTNASSLVLNGWPTSGLNMKKAAADLTIDGAVLTGGTYNVENSYYGRLDIISGNFSVNTKGSILNLDQATIENGIFDAGSGAVLTNSVLPETQYSKPVYAKAEMTVNNGKFNGKIMNSDTATLQVYGGYFSDDPAGYLGFGIATNTLTGNAPYNYQAVRAELKVEGTTADPKVVEPDTWGKDTATVNAITTITDTLSTNKPQAEGLDTSAQEYAKTFTDSNLSLINQKLQENDANVTGINIDATNVNIYTTQSLVVQVQDATVNSQNVITEIAVDVKLNSKTIMTSADSAAAATSSNSIVLENKYVETKQPITITLDLPSGFNVTSDALTIKHILADGTIKYYKGTVSTKEGTTDKQVTFIDEDGFSTIVIMLPVSGSKVLTMGTKTEKAADGTADNAVIRVYASTVADADIKADMKKATSTLALNITPTKDAIVDNSGTYMQSFTIENVDAGSYKIAVTKDGFICRILKATVSDSETKDSSILYYLGDYNKDGARDSIDVINERYSVAMEKQWAAEDLLINDLNGDDQVDTIDILKNRILIATTTGD